MIADFICSSEGDSTDQSGEVEKHSMNMKYRALLQVNLSEALILPSTNPQYDDRLFIEFRVQYMNCSECQYKNKNNLCSEHVLSL